MPGRVVVNVSSTARWTGPPVGLVRVEHELAMRARSWRSNSAVGIWDKSSAQFRELTPRWAPVVLSWRGAIDPYDPAFERHGFRRLLPSRQPIVTALERVRLTTGSRAVASAADGLQRAVLAPRRHKFALDDAQGRRLDCVPADLALGEPLALGPGDVVLLAGADWYHTQPAAISALRQRLGFRLAVVCADLIPLQHPALFPADDVALFRRYWAAMLPTADLLIVHSRVVEADVRTVAAGLGVDIGAIARAPLGFDLPRNAQPGTPLARGLIPGQYALFVSTIEPRKNHELLLSVWQRLLARGIPQQHGFRLVFVGRPGWQVDGLLRQMDDPIWQDTLLHLQGVGDSELDALYRNAAFCLYPSRYEGFGLPIIEAFARGKAVIASTGGAVPEVAGDLAPCLDPDDAAAWEQILAEWIAQPERPAVYEARIGAGFSHPDWAAAATNILTLASRAGQQ
jgi:glycosyltransferase involved in cell wall biosynthesis